MRMARRLLSPSSEVRPPLDREGRLIAQLIGARDPYAKPNSACDVTRLVVV